MPFSSSFKKAGAVSALLIAAILVYSPVFKADYINWDDPSHVQENPFIVNGDRSFLSRVFLKEETANRTYIPLTAVSFCLEKQFFGLTSFSSHLINLTLHLCNIVLILLLGLQFGLTFMAAYIAAALFAFHPMHVESVAWVTERKDVLYSFFYLLSLVFYCRFQDTRRGSFYIGALGMAILSLLSKPMALSLPLIMFLVDYIRSRPLTRRSLLEKAPFAASAFMVAGITYLMNTRVVGFSFPSSFLVWDWTFFFYLKKFFVPVDLLALYDVATPVNIHNPEYWMAALGIFVMILMLFRNRRSRWFVFAVGSYTASIFFLCRFDILDPTLVADRFMYLPSAGICFLIGFYFDKMLREPRSLIRAAAVFFIPLLFAGLMLGTCQQVKYWRNSWTFWSHILEFRPRLYFAQYMRAQSLSDEKAYRKIAPYFEQLVYCQLPSVPTTPFQKSLVQGKLKYFRSLFALRWYHHELSRPLWRKSRFQEIPLVSTYSGYINELLFIGNYNKALAFTLKKIAKFPAKTHDFIIMGRCYTNLGLYAKAFESLSMAIESDPNNYEAFLARGAVAVLLGDIGRAIDDSKRLLILDPKAMSGYDLLFNVYVTANQLEEAKKVLDQEMVLWPYDPQVSRHYSTYTRAVHSRDIP